MINERLDSQDYSNIFDQNHPSKVETHNKGFYFGLFDEPENREIREQQELERLQRRESFIKLAKAATRFKSPAKADTEKSAQNDRELQIAIAESLAGQTDSDKKFNKIIGIFENDSIPNFAKHFLSFNVIHPNPKEEFIDKTPVAETPYTKDGLMTTSKDIDPMSFGMPGTSPEQRRYKFQKIKSPMLNYLLKNGTNEKVGSRSMPSYQLLVYNDLLKCELGSDGRLTEKFVRDIQYGEDLMRDIMNGNLNINKDISTEDRAFLDSLIVQLESLYSQIDYKESTDDQKNEELETRIADLIQKIKPTSRYNLSDRLVRTFFYFNGIKSTDELLRIIKNKREYADKKNREAKEHLDLDENDLIKLVKPETLPTILENGILAKEYLGVGAKSDYTPMDTDFFGYIKPDDGDLKDGISISTGLDLKYSFSDETVRYLGIKEDNFAILVVKNNDRFKETKNDNVSLDTDKYELFFQGIFLEEDDEFFEDFDNYDDAKKEWLEERWGKRDFGVRTGLPSSEIDAIIVPSREKSGEVIDAVCNNSFYIPVYDTDGKMILSPEEYDKARFESTSK